MRKVMEVERNMVSMGVAAAMSAINAGAGMNVGIGGVPGRVRQVAGTIFRNAEAIGSRVIFGAMAQRFFTGVAGESSLPQNIANPTLSGSTLSGMVANSGNVRAITAMFGNFLTIKPVKFVLSLFAAMPTNFLLIGGIATVSLLVLFPKFRKATFSSIGSALLFAVKLPLKAAVLVLQFAVAVVRKLLGFVFKLSLLMAVASFVAAMTLQNKPGIFASTFFEISQRIFGLSAMCTVVTGIPMTILCFVSRCLACIGRI